MLAALAPVVTRPENELAYPGDPMCLYSALALTVHRSQRRAGYDPDGTAGAAFSSPFDGMPAPGGLSGQRSAPCPDWGPPPSKSYRLAAPDGGIRPLRDDTEHNSDLAIFDPRVWTDDTRASFRATLLARRPRVLLISTVSAAHRYALQMAAMAKALLPDCVVVLGGRHVDETIRCEPAARRVTFAPSSTVSVIRDGRTPPVVDFLVSGDGAYALDLLIDAISVSMTGDCTPDRAAAIDALHQFGLADRRPRGRAVIAAVDGDDVHAFPLAGAGYDLADLPAPYAAFTIRSRFPIFPAAGGGHRRTAHLMTSTSCPYRCSFCSEGIGVVGALRRFHPADLAPVLARVCQYVHYGAEAIFFDDPVFMAGNVGATTRFATLLGAARRTGGRELPDPCRRWLRDPDDRDRLAALEWGMQLTVDLLTTINDRRTVEQLLAAVRDAGCSYAYLGLESMSPTVMASIHKNRHQRGSWPQKVRAALEMIKGADLRVGTSVLFGLDGETRETIDETVEQVGRLLDSGILDLASPNVLTYHPAAEITTRHRMQDRIDYHSAGVTNRPPYVYFEEAYPGVVSRLLSEDDVWYIHRRTRARWRAGRHGWTEHDLAGVPLARADGPQVRAATPANGHPRVAGGQGTAARDAFQRRPASVTGSTGAASEAMP